MFNYAQPIPDKDTELKNTTIVAGPRVQPAPVFVPPGDLKGVVGKETLPGAFSMDKLETFLPKPVYRDQGNENGSILEIIFKPSS